MTGYRLSIDRELCQGHGICAAEAPALFQLIETDAPYPQAQVLLEQPPEDLRALAQKAARYCPNGAIRLIELDL